MALLKGTPPGVSTPRVQAPSAPATAPVKAKRTKKKLDLQTKASMPVYTAFDSAAGGILAAELAAVRGELAQQIRQQLLTLQEILELIMQQRAAEGWALEQTIQTEAERLILALPGWKNETRALKEKQALHKYGQKMGFSDEEMNQVYDHRTILVLRKAMLYDRLQAKSPARKQSKRRINQPV